MTHLVQSGIGLDMNIKGQAVFIVMVQPATSSIVISCASTFDLIFYAIISSNAFHISNAVIFPLPAKNEV